ncbi:hypothetical protein CPB86DRAFT_829869 [Serendipita vermifera]|nr:hypothetical protein CPB86DRAFT_829869 [Serendipita vermifera]
MVFQMEPSEVSVSLYTSDHTDRAFLACLSALRVSTGFEYKGLLTLRIIALYRHNPRVVWFIRAFYFGSHIATFACGIVAQVAFSGEFINYCVTILFTDPKYLGGVFFSQTFGACLRTETVVGMPFIIPAIFFAPAAFETFIFGLTAYRAWRDQFLLSSPCAAPFMTLLYRDGVIAFLIMVSLRIWNIWICFTQPLNNAFMGLPSVPPHHVTFIVLGALRGLISREVDVIKNDYKSLKRRLKDEPVLLTLACHTGSELACDKNLYIPRVLIIIYRLMWAGNTVLTARVYLNLVWLARKPIVNLDTTNEEFSGGVSANFRLQIRQNTTVRTEDL